MNYQIRSTGAIAFQDGLRQPGLGMEISFTALPELRYAEIDDVVKQAFEIEAFRLHCAESVRADGSHARTLWFLERVCTIALAILQDIKIPCFEAVRVTRIVEPATGQSHTTVHLTAALVDHVPVKIIVDAYAAALRYLALLATRLQQGAAFDELLVQLQSEFVEPSLPRIAGGKSTIPILSAAFDLNVPFMHLGYGVYQLGWGAQRRLFSRSSSHLDSHIGTSVSTHKHSATMLMASAGLPTPANHLVRQEDEALEAAEKLGYPVVIKPVDCDRGEGVSINIRSPDQVRQAFAKAASLSRQVLVERQIPGVCHRIAVADGQLLFAVRRDPRSITADGRRPIRELIKAANDDLGKKAILKRLPPYPADALAQDTLSRLGFGFDSIPPAGMQVPLRPIQSSEWGGSPQDVTQAIHPANIELAVRAANLLQLNVAGIDLMSQDISVPWYVNGAAINEVNQSPVLGRTHAYQREGVQRLVRSAFPRGGRIPVEVFVGGSRAFERAAQRHRDLLAKEAAGCFLVTHNAIEGPAGPWPADFAASDAYQRVRAVLLNPQARCLVVALSEAEFQRRGLPVDAADRLVVD